MSGKIRLGKTKDSRTRRKAKVQDAEAALRHTETLEGQKDFMSYLYAKGYGNETIRRYARDIRAFHSWTEKENITSDYITYNDVLHYIQGRKITLSQRSVCALMSSLKQYFDYLEHTGQYTENPAAHIKIQGVKRKILYDVLQKNELESLYKNFEIPDENGSYKNYNWFKTSIAAARRNKVMLGLMIWQGLNTHELGALREQDVKLREGKIYIAGSRRSNERELKLEAHQVMDIMEYQIKIRPAILQLTGKQTDGFFPSIGNGEHFSNVMVKLLKKLHRQNRRITSVKQIRTSVITHWLKLYNLRQVQYMAGHRYVSSTEAYKINDLEDLGEEIQRYHPIE